MCRIFLHFLQICLRFTPIGHQLKDVSVMHATQSHVRLMNTLKAFGTPHPYRFLSVLFRAWTCFLLLRAVGQKGEPVLPCVHRLLFGFALPSCLFCLRLLFFFLHIFLKNVTIRLMSPSFSQEKYVSLLLSFTYHHHPSFIVLIIHCLGQYYQERLWVSLFLSLLSLLRWLYVDHCTIFCCTWLPLYSLVLHLPDTGCNCRRPFAIVMSCLCLDGKGLYVDVVLPSWIDPAKPWSFSVFRGAFNWIRSVFLSAGLSLTVFRNNTHTRLLIISDLISTQRLIKKKGKKE